MWALFVMQVGMLVAKPLLARVPRLWIAVATLALSVALALLEVEGPAVGPQVHNTTVVMGGGQLASFDFLSLLLI